MEETLDSFLTRSGPATPEAFAARFQHPFLFREVLTGSETRNLTRAELEEQAERFRRMAGRSRGYVLSQHGSMSIEGLLKDVVVAGERTLEARVVGLGPRSPLTVGSAPGSDLVLAVGGVEAASFSLEREGTDFAIVVRGESVSYGGQRCAPGTRLVLEEGLFLQLAPDALFQTFTSSGFAHFLAFRSKLAAALAAGPG